MAEPLRAAVISKLRGQTVYAFRSLDLAEVEGNTKVTSLSISCCSFVNVELPKSGASGTFLIENPQGSALDLNQVKKQVKAIFDLSNGPVHFCKRTIQKTN